jgi:hypothetical protein
MNRSENRLLPMVISGQPPRRMDRSDHAAKPAAPFAAQLYGQAGQRRGLKGGAPVLEAARAAYLGVEFCGENDRRPAPGLLKRAVV